MRYTIDNDNTIRCANCGSEYIKASAKVEVDLTLFVYDNMLSVDIDNIDCDEYDLFDITCSDCGYTIAGSFFELRNIIKEKGDKDE